VKILVALEHHFIRCPQGVYTELAFAYDYWSEYLEVFDEVVVVARVKYLMETPSGMIRADGKGVVFVDIIEYTGIKSFLKRFPLVFCQALKATRTADRYLLRAGNIGTIMWICLLLTGKLSYAQECMTHIYEGIVTEHPKSFFHKMIAALLHVTCKTQTRWAQYASYTSDYLRQTYPCRSRRNEFVFSGVRLSDEVITSERPTEFFRESPFRLISIGRVEPQKGHNWLVEAAAELALRENINDWTLDIIGPGSQVSVLEKKVQQYGPKVQNKIRIVGGVPWGKELFDYIDRSHLFILPSLTESMPRALIEAMSRGIPAIGSKTGGITELLPPADLVTVGNIRELQEKIISCMRDPHRLAEMLKRNYLRAQKFRLEVTTARKMAFWGRVLDGKI
jgi:glycosyltransferase involved in cell wall biosynthesis